MVRTPLRGVVWLASLAFVFGAFPVIFGIERLLRATTLSSGITGLVTAAVGVLWIVVAAGLARSTWWGWTLAVGMIALHLAGIGVFVLLAPAVIPFLSVPAMMNLVVLGYLMANRRHFARRSAPDDPLPTIRNGRFE